MKKVNPILTLYTIYIVASLLSLYYFSIPPIKTPLIKSSSAKSDFVAALEGFSEAGLQAMSSVGDILQRVFYYTITMTILSIFLFVFTNILQKRKITYGFIFLLFIDISVAFFACYLSQFFPLRFFENGEELLILVFISFVACNIYFYRKYYRVSVTKLI